MQKLTINNTARQNLLNDFQDKIVNSLHGNNEIFDSFKELIFINSPINGIITITQPTKSYIKYIKTLGIKLEKDKPIMNYIPFDQYLKENKDNLYKELLLLLKQYMNLSALEKRNKFLIVFQIPLSNNPTQSLKNIYIIDDIHV